MYLDGRCAGLLPGESCTDSIQCSAGYYCNANVWTVVAGNGNACTNDNDWAIDQIWDITLNTCNFVYHENEWTTIGDARRCKTGVKGTQSGNTGRCRVTEYIQQNGANLTNNQCDLDTGNVCQLRARNNARLYPELRYNDFTQLAFTISNPTDWHCLYNKTGFCMPIGSEAWHDMADYWKQNIITKLKSHCHQSRRFNPMAWVDCHQNLNMTKLAIWVDMFYNLTTHVYMNDPDGYYQEYIATVNMFSPRNWRKISSAFEVFNARTILLIFFCVFAIMAQ